MTSTEEKLSQLENDKMAGCTRCKLSENRQNIVFGEGNPEADVMLIGEAPGAKEDETGRPFVGRSGKLLTKILEKAGYEREDIYITNIVKCKPPNNRNPKEDEIAACSNCLRAQIYFIEPEAIITAGKPATNTVAGFDDKPMHKLLKKKDLEHPKEDVPIVPIYHPAYILRQEDSKKKSLAKSTVKRMKVAKQGGF